MPFNVSRHGDPSGSVCARAKHVPARVLNSPMSLPPTPRVTRSVSAPIASNWAGAVWPLEVCWTPTIEALVAPAQLTSVRS